MIEEDVCEEAEPQSEEEEDLDEEGEEIGGSIRLE